LCESFPFHAIRMGVTMVLSGAASGATATSVPLRKTSLCVPLTEYATHVQAPVQPESAGEPASLP